MEYKEFKKQVLERMKTVEFPDLTINEIIDYLKENEDEIKHWFEKSTDEELWVLEQGKKTPEFEEDLQNFRQGFYDENYVDSCAKSLAYLYE